MAPDRKTRRSKNAGADSSQPPRPSNAWILYRADKCREMPGGSQGTNSKVISAMWKNESAEVRAVYEAMAERAKQAHALEYPGYKYRPGLKKEAKKLRKQEQEQAKLEGTVRWASPELAEQKNSSSSALVGTQDYYYAPAAGPSILPPIHHHPLFAAQPASHIQFDLLYPNPPSTGSGYASPVPVPNPAADYSGLTFDNWNPPYAAQAQAQQASDAGSQYYVDFDAGAAGL
ncbi:Silenced mating-type M-specific polypeptide Mc [Mycena kentingensis (nom. inval.)]|nr:Silenced mating-type M-specific polypeptide Mc [Mycena kentingensis (nom. inval.)]